MFLNTIYNFFKALVPGITKKSILENLYSTYGEIESINSPMYDLDIGTVRGNTADMLKVRLKGELDFGNGQNLIQTVKVLLGNCTKNQDAVIAAVKETFEETLPRASMDYYQLNIFKYTESVAFVAVYTRRLLNVLVWEFLLATLTDKAEKDSDYVELLPGSKTGMLILNSPALRADREFVTSSTNILGFITAANMLNKPFAAYEKSIQKLKGHLVNEADWDGSDKPTERMADPYAAGFIPVVVNPFYWAGMAFVTWRVACNERNKADLGRVQLMLRAINDKKAKTSTEDIAALRALDKQIEHFDNVANILSAKIEDMEGTLNA